ncbi:hypothetical protein [Streptomyces angustmyceticus]|uniref:hypothetical protein n=1 Tax=Streptomyces angustmyceticus TaxID=285578 RepID=UPI0037F5A96B
MTAFFEWTGLASVVVNGAVHVVAALLPAGLEHRRAKRIEERRRALVPFCAYSPDGRTVVVEVAGANRVELTVHAGSAAGGPSSKERAQW